MYVVVGVEDVVNSVLVLDRKVSALRQFLVAAIVAYVNRLLPIIL